MVDPVVTAVSVAVVKATVGGLLTELVKEGTSPVWNRNQNRKSLGRLLEQLEPIVDGIPPSTTSPAKLWLEKLGTRLESVKDVLQESSRCGQYGIKQLSISKKLVKEIKQLNEILSTAPVASMSVAASADVAGLHERLTGISEQLEELTNEFQRQNLGQTTGNSLGTPINSYDKTNGLMPVNMAYDSIKEEPNPVLLSSTHDVAEGSGQASTQYRRLDSVTMFGGDEVVEEAKRLLLEENCHKLGLWAAGGTGKTHAAVRVFNDETIRAHFKGGCFFLTVGRNLPLKNTLYNLHQEITKRKCERRNISIEDLKNQLCNELGGKKDMLMVLDDVCEEDVLSSLLAVVPSKAGSKVLVTTRRYDILDKNDVTKHQVPRLSPENSWKLFCSRAFGGVSKVPSGLEKLAREVTTECGGIPLALKVIGSVFKGKTERDYWKLSLEKLKNAESLDMYHEKELFERLKLSIDELPAKLKDCLFYFAAFPEDEKVSVYEDLLPLWVGDGIVTNRSYDLMRGEARELVGLLVSRSLIEMHQIYGFLEELSSYYTIHDVLRDLVRDILHKVPVAQRECLYEAGRDLEFPQEWTRSEGKGRSGGRAMTLSARRMSVMSSNHKELPPRLWDARELQVLLLRNNPFSIIPDAFFNSLQNIRVLDLSGTSVTALPKSIAILKRLLVLNVSRTPLAKLPDSLGNLISLEQLYLVSCNCLSRLPASLSSLTRLQILSVRRNIRVWKDRGRLRNFLAGRFVLQDLRSLAALRQLCICYCSQTTLPAGLFTALKKLEKLELKWFDQLRRLPDLAPGDLRHLQVLSLWGCGSLISLPSSLGSLPLLETLILRFCWALTSLPALDGLPNLVKLDLSYCFGLESLPATFGRKDAFPVLEELRMLGCRNVVSFPELEDGAMPSLQLLDLGGWSKLDTLTKSLAALKNLRFLGLNACSNLKTLEHDDLSFTSFANLEELEVRECGVLELPASIAQLPNFKLLRISQDMASIPKALEREISKRKSKCQILLITTFSFILQDSRRSKLLFDK